MSQNSDQIFIAKSYIPLIYIEIWHYTHTTVGIPVSTTFTVFKAMIWNLQQSMDIGRTYACHSSDQIFMLELHILD